MIELKNLNKSYGDKSILSDINVKFDISEVIGIVGKNGAGKSTLFKCIAGLENYEGEIVFSNNLDSRKIGYLPTQPFIMERLTGSEYLHLLCRARNLQTPDLKSYNLFNLPLNEYASNYSTGMKKKLAILGVLFQNNDIYLLDEPFNGLDLESNIILNKIIKKLKEKNKLILVSSHILSNLFEICDHTNLIQDTQLSRLNVEDDIDQIFNNSVLDDFDKNLDSLI